MNWFPILKAKYILVATIYTKYLIWKWTEYWVLSHQQGWSGCCSHSHCLTTLYSSQLWQDCSCNTNNHINNHFSHCDYRKIAFIFFLLNTYVFTKKKNKKYKYAYASFTLTWGCQIQWLWIWWRWSCLCSHKPIPSKQSKYSISCTLLIC